ncbi:MAG TPA: DGQHR domain-containing protein [Candidatus Angelobacter sp.]
MTVTQRHNRREVDALRVHQWLHEWNSVSFGKAELRRKPEPHFYLFTLPAAELKALSGIYRRTTAGGQLRSHDLGIQRRHDENRSEEIGRFVKHGYPWSNLNKRQRQSDEFRNLRKPGWLPTAVVINILRAEDSRRGETVHKSDLINIVSTGNGIARITLPQDFDGSDWHPTGLHPLEVIDGQHRLWAFEGEQVPHDYELPVVAFHGLDLSWQAYLFWTINIKPKRINPSLAFDLYPLLRTEDWLERFEGPAVYRETRAQELTEIMWSHPYSPWFHRINMLGEPGTGAVTQAAWIRSLLATYVRSFEGPGVTIGGLFGAPVGADRLALPWSKFQQGAFLITLWEDLRQVVESSAAEWAQKLRNENQGGKTANKTDPAFVGSFTLLNQDQGVRAVLHITNDLTFIRHEELALRKWGTDPHGDDELQMVADAIDSMPKAVTEFLEQMTTGLARFDWRTANTPGLTEEEKLKKLVYRGSGGYAEFRRQLLNHVVAQRGPAGRAAQLVLRAEQKKK